ncbi:histidine kinase [Streptomyces sp. NPDC087440]|uniref:sensor histidine kinase n=1 Tax=Streptomyces sp. NPDC087440 TaxID=3365790 RepID=UPI00382C0C37
MIMRRVTLMGERAAGGRTKRQVMATMGTRARSGLRHVRTDLLTLRADPMPGMRDGWPPLLPHVLVVAFAGALFFGVFNNFQSDFQLDGSVSSVLSAFLAVALAGALNRPALCWWIITATTVVGALVAGGPAQDNATSPWTGFGLVVHAVALFLLALRVRVLSLAVAAGAALVAVFAVRTGPDGIDSLPLTVLAVAAFAGAAQRRTRLARNRLVEQEGVTAEERARRTLLEERSRIARELHDVVAHHMSVISIQAQVAPHLTTDPSPELRENLAGIRQNALDALTELRRVLGVLRNGEGDDGAGGARHAPQPTLDQLGELLAGVRSAGLTVTTEITGTPRPYSPGVELSAYRIVQEALSNAMRHAPGAAVHVAVGHHASALSIRVANTAPTTRAPHPFSGDGHGVLGMRERVSMLGGEFSNGSTVEGGYLVVAVLPLAADVPGKGSA